MKKTLFLSLTFLSALLILSIKLSTRTAEAQGYVNTGGVKAIFDQNALADCKKNPDCAKCLNDGASALCAKCSKSVDKFGCMLDGLGNQQEYCLKKFGVSY